MSQLLQSGQRAQSASGQPCTIGRLLGGGGQGEVYAAEWCGRPAAVKWYYAGSATPEQREALSELVRLGSPAAEFLWPEDLVEAAGTPGFGYIMRLREPRFRSLNDYVAGRFHPRNIPLITAAMGLTKAMRALHAAGLCYRDISFGNAFFDPTTGEVLICDNDNVATNRSANGGVLGTPDFMAPEIVTGQARPSTATDLHSLAVLLFYAFHLSHPLLGRRVLDIRCWDIPAREKLFGPGASYIFGGDPANAAVSFDEDPLGEAGGNAIAHAPLYPARFKAVFHRAFTDGLADPDRRVTEAEWLDALAGLRDSIFPCSGCSAPNFFDGSATKPCWSCGTIPAPPFRLRIGKTVVMLNADSNLFGHHLDDGRPWDYATPTAAVVQHPTDPSVWGLKNLTQLGWVITTADGAVKDVAPGRSVPLAAGTRVDFGKTTGEVQY